MPVPADDREAVRAAASSDDSPRAAIVAARVYRGNGRSLPRERGLRLLALLGALLVHFAFLLGVVWGPAYEPLPPAADTGSTPLEVRLLDRPPPPPPAAVRGWPPRGQSGLQGPRRRGSVAGGARQPSIGGLPALPAVPPAMPTVAAPSAQKLLVAPSAFAVKPHVAKTAASSFAGATVRPIPLNAAPPTIDLRLPPWRPTPPRFQPEPVRRVQPEGNQPMPPPASLALQPIDAPSPSQSMPHIAMQVPQAAREKVAIMYASSPATLPAEAAAAPPASPGAVPAIRDKAAAASEQAASAALSGAPGSTTEPQRRPEFVADLPEVTEPPLSPPRIELPALPARAPQPPDVQPTRALPAPALTAIRAATSPQPSPASEQSAERPDGVPAPDADSAIAQADRRADRPSQAPRANTLGRDDAELAQPESDVDERGNAAGEHASSSAVAGGSREDRPGADAAEHASGPGVINGAERSATGSYVQLRPHGDTQIMEHRASPIGYRPTRFEKDWTPLGESSIDTALRRTVQKFTLRHTFHLPRGVRVECTVSPLFPMIVLGCHNPDPPPQVADPQLYARLNLGRAQSLAPAPAASAAPLPPIILDHAAECAAARVTGGPLPPGCAAPSQPPPVTSASAQGAWASASDQFH